MTECEHVTHLRRYLAEHGLKVWAEISEGGWVNVHCAMCHVTHEVSLRAPPEREEESA